MDNNPMTSLKFCPYGSLWREKLAKPSKSAMLNTSASSEDKKMPLLSFPGSSVVKIPPANAGDTGSIPSLARSHMPPSSATASKSEHPRALPQQQEKLPQ